MTHSAVWPAPGHSWVLPESSNASPNWPGRRAATARPRGFSARRTPSGNEPARSASKSTKPATIRQSRCRVMLWAARTLTQSGPTVSPFPPTKRSPTPNAGAANARSPRAASVANRYFARTGRTGPGLTLCRVPAFERQCRWPGAGFAKVNARTGDIGKLPRGYARGQRHCRSKAGNLITINWHGSDRAVQANFRLRTHWLALADSRRNRCRETHR